MRYFVGAVVCAALFAVWAMQFSAQRMPWESLPEDDCIQRGTRVNVWSEVGMSWEITCQLPGEPYERVFSGYVDASNPQMFMLPHGHWHARRWVKCRDTSPLGAVQFNTSINPDGEGWPSDE